MWPVPGNARALTLVLASAAAIVTASDAEAQNAGGANNPYYFNNQSYSYGLQLPQVPQPNGQDEIRAADGTTCRSNAASNGAYLDVGGIGGQGIDGSFDSGTVYGRLIMPLGDIPKRLDCSSLYNLEIERLKHELDLVRAGLNGGGGLSSAAPAGKPGKSWAENGWSDKGWKASAKAGAAQASADRLPAATIVPMRLQPAGAVNAVPAATVAGREAQADVEILPWSTEPALGARVLTSGKAMRPPEKESEAMPETMPGAVFPGLPG